MTNRNRVKNKLRDAWESCIEEDYCSQRINSERSLQASYWSHLIQLLDTSTRRVFIEPSMVGIEPRIVPDIVICNTRAVIAVVELKYLPRAAAAYKKDIDSLVTIAEGREVIELDASRYRGSGSHRERYGIAKDCLFVWAGVHVDAPKPEGYAVGKPALDGSYIELHAITSHGERPEVIIR